MKMLKCSLFSYLGLIVAFFFVTISNFLSTYCGTLKHMWFCKENQAIGLGEGTAMVISREPDNEMK